MDGKPAEYYGNEAKQFTKEYLLNKNVELKFDVGQRDKYGRLLAYVYINGEMFNRILLEKGYAKIMTIKPNIKYSSEFSSIEKTAKSNKIGLWGK